MLGRGRREASRAALPDGSCLAQVDVTASWRRPMQPFTLVLITLTLAAAGPVQAAGETHVPGDFPDPQSAINTALPGDLIVVHGGSWYAAAGSGKPTAGVITRPVAGTLQH